MALNVTVIAVDPETEYQGKVYENRVVLQPKIGDAFGAFDPDLVLSEKHVGTEQNVALSTLLSDGSVARIDETDYCIKPNPANPTGWKNHTYCGKVTRIGEQDDYRYGVLLEVGCGTIYLDPKKDLVEGLKIGDALKVKPLRTDVIRLE